jgi:pimeloyl-ACP methyl ester carboxylesterase
MSGVHTLHVEGHTLVALTLNEPDTLGHPVILIHGINSSVRFWGQDQIPAFLEQGPCYALSLPGHYPAAFPPGFQKEQLTAERIARVLAAAILELVGDRPVTLAGFSTGGFAALAIAAYAPQWVRRVISISGFCQGRWTGVLGTYRWLARQGVVGRGSMGDVYRATDIHTGERVTVKALDPGVVARDPGILKRFVREGEALRQLDHPKAELLDELGAQEAAGVTSE